MRVQIISSRVGGGHMSVAEALRQAFAAQPGPPLTVWVDDLYLEHTRPPGSWLPTFYAVATRHYPWLWRLAYDVTNRPPSGARLNWVGDLLGGESLRDLIRVREPDVVITVLPGTTGFVARSVLRSGVPARVEVVVTDWAYLHLAWASTFTASYTVPTANAAETVTAVGIPPDDVHVCGFVVREQFAHVSREPADRQRVRHQLGLSPDRFVILAMVGAEGSPAALAHLEALIQAPLDADILVVCGRNRRLYGRVERLKSLAGSNTVRPLGFVENVAELMVSCDLLLTKTGGVTLAEAFCCHLPVLAFDPLPGQEEGNARYVVQQGAAELAESPRHLVDLARELRWSAERQEQLAARAALLATPAAARDTVRGILARLA